MACCFAFVFFLTYYGKLIKNEALQFLDVGLSRVLSDIQLDLVLMFDLIVCRQTSGFQQSLMCSVVWSVDKLSPVSSAVSTAVMWSCKEV